MTLEELRFEVKTEVGSDINSRYEQKYDLTQILRDLFADVCILEFLRGFFDFEALGNGARARVEQFISTYQDDPGIERLGIYDDVDGAISIAPIPDSEDSKLGREQLEVFLIKYGMSPTLAGMHAAVIEEQVRSAVASRKPENSANA
jgi:hypothetical protein